MRVIPQRPEKILFKIKFSFTKKLRQDLAFILKDLIQFASELGRFVLKRLHISYSHFEIGKGVLVTSLYRQRGKYAKRLIHSGMAGLAGLAVVLAPVVAQEFPGRNVDPWSIPSSSVVLSSATQSTEISTNFSDKVRGEIIEYTVQKGDAVSSIADKYGISSDTIRWQNNLKSKDAIKEGQSLEILPVTGVSHKVKKGDTVYSIAKQYDIDPQVIVNYPFNTYSNDEKFELAIGQTVIVPEGVKTEEVYGPPVARIKQTTPDAGTVVASGIFVWPASGTITQRFVWYHPGLDIANRGMPDVLAADSGTVIVAGWPDNYGYGNRIIIDHGNGYKTLYGHLSKFYVVPGQTVARGNAIAKMGSTGRSTGPHLHFEVIRSGVHINPLTVLK